MYRVATHLELQRIKSTQHLKFRINLVISFAIIKDISISKQQY